MAGRFQRLYRGETTIDFYGKRNIGFLASGIIVLATIISLFAQGLNLGIDFKGGVAWEVPVTSTFGTSDARAILEANEISTTSAKIQTLTSGTNQRIRVQVGDEPADVVEKVKSEFAAKAGVELDLVSVASVSSTWGRSITEKAIRALLVFFGLVSLFIAWRFEWKMAVGAIAAMAHDVFVSVGVYSILGLEVTPATVVAFLTILGFSLYDTIVVFDKVHDNTARFKGSRASYGDVVNVSMNQVLMRSLNTSIAAVLPVLSLLVLGAWVMGAIALQEFALALLVGLITGAYSSIYIATPLLGILKEREAAYSSHKGVRALGDDMSRLMATGTVTGRRAAARREQDAPAENVPVTTESTTVAAVLSHPPRPRKKTRR